MHQMELKEPSEMASVLDRKAIELLRIIERVIQEGIENGEIAPRDTWNATNVLWGMMDGVIMLAERKNVMVMNVSLDELFKEAIRIIFYGMTGEESVINNGSNKENKP
jgi:hypothetical protein